MGLANIMVNRKHLRLDEVVSRGDIEDCEKKHWLDLRNYIYSRNYIYLRNYIFYNSYFLLAFGV